MKDLAETAIVGELRVAEWHVCGCMCTPVYMHA